jgi:two-component system NarL family sensor kinase
MLAIGLTCICLLTHAQDNPKRDSLWMILQNSQQDTIKVLNLLLYGEQYEISDPDSAMYYYKIAKSLSEKIGYKKGLSSYTGYTIAILNNQGKFREALELCKENAQLWEGSENKQELAAAYINLGSEWQYLSDFQTAAENYLKALSFAEAIQHLPYQRVAYNNLASLFNSLQQYDKGRSYAQRSLDIAIALKNEYGIASSLINLGNAENSLKIFDSSLSRFLQVEALGNKMEDQVITMDGWLGIAETYTLQQRWNEAEPYLLKTFTLSKSIETNEYQLYACMGLGDLYIRTKQYGKADIYLQTGTDLAKALGTRLELKDLYFKKAELQEAKGETAEALLWYKKFVLLDDSLTNEKINNNINLGEIKYETDKKELQIENLEAQRKLQQLTIKQQNTFNWVLGGSALSILFIALLGWRNFRQKQLLQKQQIIDLEKEKQLLATESMLKGQEEERSRLAKDLHDGLGGMLSGVKFSFSNLKETMHMEQQDMKSFERNIDLLDSSIKELRRVAHSMMPEVLIKYGLDAALRDYCTFINTSGIIKVIYQSHGLENIGTNQTVNVTIYRVIQELLNNIVKHAGATTAIVEINKEGQKIVITVDDDGKGIDKNALQNGNGIGWANITNRLNYLKARVDIQSETGKGTSVNIDFDVDA